VSFGPEAPKACSRQGHTGWPLRLRNGDRDIELATDAGALALADVGVRAESPDQVSTATEN